MNIRFHEKLYTDMSGKKLTSIKKKVRRKSTKLNLFLITLPLGNQGILEIYWYPELLQKFYQKMNVEVIVVGLANSREQAFKTIEKIVTEIGLQDGNIPVKEFFKESK